MDFKTQLLPLLGVIVGAGMTFVGSNIIERARWGRQQAIRWDERRLDAYTRYAFSVKRNSTAIARILAGKGITKSIKPVEEEVGLLALAEAEAERSELFEAVLLLGDTAAIEAGMNLNRVVWKMQSFGRGEVTVDATDWANSFKEYRHARLAFVEAARRSMGVPAAAIPPTSVWLDAVTTEANR